MANFESIRLEKGMYKTGRPFTQVLEELDPSEQYQGTELGKLDAYERQLKRFDIKVSGAYSDKVEKFFMSTDATALFPEYISRAVHLGVENADMLEKVTAAVTKIEGMDYRTIVSDPSEDDKELKRVNEGAAIPKTTIKTQGNLVRLHKRGRLLEATYEAIRFQRLDLFTVTLKQIGAFIARSQFQDAVNVLINGDGNGNAAPTGNVATAGTVAYSDLITFWNNFAPYELNTMVASPDVAAKLLNMSEFRDAMAGLNFHGKGNLITPLGANLLKSSAVPAGKLLGLDRSCALEMVKATEIETDYDKLIDRQLERASITCIAGFAKIFANAARVLTI